MGIFLKWSNILMKLLQNLGVKVGNIMIIFHCSATSILENDGKNLVLGSKSNGLYKLSHCW
jgi:hypothetical protein